MSPNHTYCTHEVHCQDEAIHHEVGEGALDSGICQDEAVHHEVGEVAHDSGDATHAACRPISNQVVDFTLQVAEEVTQWEDGPANIHNVRVGMLVAQPHMRDEMDSLALPWLQMRSAAFAACRCASDTAIRDLARTLLVGIAASSPSEFAF